VEDFVDGFKKKFRPAKIPSQEGKVKGKGPLSWEPFAFFMIAERLAD
jgi:hypothetical protein